jgi:hypothetical protein
MVLEMKRLNETSVRVQIHRYRRRRHVRHPAPARFMWGSPKNCRHATKFIFDAAIYE